MRDYADYPPEECRCRWRNYSDNGGWWRISTNDRCLIHGNDDNTNDHTASTNGGVVADGCS